MANSDEGRRDRWVVAEVSASRQSAHEGNPPTVAGGLCARQNDRLWRRERRWRVDDVRSGEASREAIAQEQVDLARWRLGRLNEPREVAQVDGLAEVAERVGGLLDGHIDDVHRRAACDVIEPARL